MKLKGLLTLLALLFFIQLPAQKSNLEDIRQRWFNPQSEKVMVVAHRANWRDGGENTIAAIQSAINLGVDIIEIDLKRTKDGRLILMHDQTLDRTTNGTGKVSDHTLAEIKALDFKDPKSIGKVPTLEEALTIAKGKIMINLDHAFNYWEEIIPILEKTGTTRQIILKSGVAPQEVKEKYGHDLDKVIFMPIVNLDAPDALQRLKDCMELLKPQAIELIYAKKDNPLPLEAKKLMQGKAHVWYNTLWSSLAGGNDDATAAEDPDKVYGHLVTDFGAKILQTDNPQFLIDYLKEKNWK